MVIGRGPRTTFGSLPAPVKHFSARRRGSPLPQHQIDHPAAANVRPRPAAVVEDVGVVAPGVLQRVGQDRHRGEVAGLVHLPARARRRWTVRQLGVEGDGAEGVAEDVAEDDCPFIVQQAEQVQDVRE